MTLETNLSEKNTEPVLNESPPDKEILSAFNSKKIIDCTDIELDLEVTAAVAMAFTFIGKKNDSALSDNLLIIYQLLPAELKKEVPVMRIKEIGLAIKKGIYKEFGEFFGLNVAEFVRFCKSHYDSELRSSAAKTILKPVESEQKPPTPEQQFYLFKNLCIESYNFFENNKPFETRARTCYDFLNKIKLIIFSKKEKYDILEKAAQLVISDQNIKLSVIFEDFNRKPLKRIIQAITESLENDKPLPKYVKEMVINKAKYLTLNAFFHDLQDSELDLSDLINAKKELFIA